jgi:hypothetical protein
MDEIVKNPQEARHVRVIVNHVIDGNIITRDMYQAPHKGDWISLGSNTYVVKQVIWNYSDACTVKVIVEDPKD